MLEWRRKRRSRATGGQVYRCTLWVCFDRLWVRARGRERYSEGWGGGIKEGRFAAGNLCGVSLRPLLGYSVMLCSVGQVLCGDASHQGVGWKVQRQGRSRCETMLGESFRRRRNHKPWIDCKQRLEESFRLVRHSVCVLSHIKERQRLGCGRTSYCYIITWKWEPSEPHYCSPVRPPTNTRPDTDCVLQQTLHASTHAGWLFAAIDNVCGAYTDFYLSAVRMRTKFATMSCKCHVTSSQPGQAAKEKTGRNVYELWKCCEVGRLQRSNSSPTSHGRYTAYKTPLVSVMSHLMQTCSLSHLCDWFIHTPSSFNHTEDVSDSGAKGHVRFSSPHSLMDLFCCENVVLLFLT